MKKNLFRKFLALFLTGTMLAGVGCKDYDDDIDKLNNRLDELTTGKIATLESQLSSLQTSVDNLKSADEALGKRIDELKSDADANAKDIEALEKAQEQLQKDIEAIEKDLSDNYVTKSYLNTTLSSYATTKYVGDAVAAVTQNLGKFTTEKAIQDAINAAKDAAIKAAGDACKDAFQTSFDAAVASANLVNETKLTKAIDDYDVKIKQYLEDAVTKEDGFINKAIAQAVSDAVADLQAMISGRLTSVLLIPDLYVGGIETIEDPGCGVFVYAGTDPDTSMYAGLETVDGYLVTNEKMETSIPGVYAAGDIRAKQVRQAATAVADGAIAAINAAM